MKKVYKKVIVLVALIVVLSGFGIGAKLLLSDSTDKLTLNYMLNTAINLERENMTEAYLAQEEVKGQLEVGERAIIYFPEMSRDYPTIAVARHEIESDWENWHDEIQQVNYALPHTILNSGFTFEGGLKDDPFYPTIPFLLQDEFIDNLEQKRQEAVDEKSIIWEKIDLSEAEFLWDTLATKYVNDEGISIYVVANLYDDNVMKIDSYLGESSTINQKSVHGKQMTYVKNNNALTSTGIIQSVTWIEDTETGSALYSVMSEHEIVTDEILYEVAAEVMGAQIN